MKQAQTLARHSTPTLTLMVYAHVGMDELGKALDAMPPTPGADGNRAVAGSAK